MENQLPGIVVTGASGFIGRNFVEKFADKYRLFCLARRSQLEAGIRSHRNIRWTQVDIGSFADLQSLAENINKHGGADYVIHLAGYYDFTYKDHPEYYRTNVQGTENVLKLASTLQVRRFIFASSLAACEFRKYNKLIVSEDSHPDANFPYARSKRAAEEIVKSFAPEIPFAIVRLAAVYSDWCEYPPLFMFLTTWLSKKWKSRILGGKGTSSITYIHINDMVTFLNLLLEKDHILPKDLILIASPNGTVSHNDLYQTSTKLFFGKTRKAIRIPKIIAYPGTIVMNAISPIFGRETFEKPWMIKYLDKKLVVDAKFTQETLGWETSSRYDILRRLLFVLENMKNHHITWATRNEVALRKVTERTNLMFYGILIKNRPFVVSKMTDFVLLPENKQKFHHYNVQGKEQLKLYTTLIYQLISTSIRTGNRIILRRYAQIIAYRRFTGGYPLEEINHFLNALERIMKSLAYPELSTGPVKQRFMNQVSIAIQLVSDEIDESYDKLRNKQYNESINDEMLPSLGKTEELKKILSQLEDIFYNSMEFQNGNFAFEKLI